MPAETRNLAALNEGNLFDFLPSLEGSDFAYSVINPDKRKNNLELQGISLGLYIISNLIDLTVHYGRGFRKFLLLLHIYTSGWNPAINIFVRFLVLFSSVVAAKKTAK